MKTITIAVMLTLVMAAVAGLLVVVHGHTGAIKQLGQASITQASNDVARASNDVARVTLVNGILREHARAVGVLLTTVERHDKLLVVPAPPVTEPGTTNRWWWFD